VLLGPILARAKVLVAAAEAARQVRRWSLRLQKLPDRDQAAKINSCPRDRPEAGVLCAEKGARGAAAE